MQLRRSLLRRECHFSKEFVAVTSSEAFLLTSRGNVCYIILINCFRTQNSEVDDEEKTFNRAYIQKFGLETATKLVLEISCVLYSE